MLTREMFMIFTKFLPNPQNQILAKKSAGSQFAKFNPHKFFFFSFFRISKTYSCLSIKNGHVKNILQDIKQYKKRQYRKKNVNLFIISAPFN